MNTSTFCLGLVSDGKPVIGVIYNFPNDQLYSAAKGLGANHNGRPLKPVRTEPLPIVPVEWWVTAANDAWPLLNKLHSLRYQTPNYTSSAYTGMQVALGILKGLVYAGDKPWDVVATKIIFDELGYLVTDFDGNDQRYDQAIRGAIISDGSLHKELLG
jgi:myo-inositol-1(or 4)-monophosphatase